MTFVIVFTGIIVMFEALIQSGFAREKHRVSMVPRRARSEARKQREDIRLTILLAMRNRRSEHRDHKSLNITLLSTLTDLMDIMEESLEW